jgi:hypothetical protein
MRRSVPRVCPCWDRTLTSAVTQRVDHYIHTLFAGVLVDSGWRLDTVRKLFNKLCLPFFARFVGTYDKDRLATIPEPGAGKLKLEQTLDCSGVKLFTSVGSDGLFRALGQICSRPIAILLLADLSPSSRFLPQSSATFGQLAMRIASTMRLRRDSLIARL